MTNTFGEIDGSNGAPQPEQFPSGEIVSILRFLFAFGALPAAKAMAIPPAASNITALIVYPSLSSG